MEIGDRIKYRRELLKMSQEELAKKVGYKSRSSINKIEIDGRGLPQNKIVVFAKALETTPAYLMGWETEEKLQAVLSDNSEMNSMSSYKQLFNAIGCEFKFSVKKYQNGKQTIKDITIKTDSEEFLVSLEDLSKYMETVTAFAKFNLSTLKNNKCPKDYEYIYKAADEYVNCELYPIVNAARPVTNEETTEEMKKHDDDIIDDDNF